MQYPSVRSPRIAAPSQADQAESLHGAGLACLQRGDVARSVELFAQAARAEPGNATILLNLAAALRRLGRLEEALAIARRVVDMNPLRADGQNILANLLSDLGRPAEAAEALRRLLVLTPRATEPRLRLSRELLMAERPEDAVEALLTLLGMTPLSAAAYTNLGVALKKLGRMNEAVEAYGIALGFSPGEAGILNNLGIVQQEMDQEDEAAQSFRQAIAVRPDFAEAHLNLALLARDRMELDLAIEGARDAVRLSPNLAEAHTALGYSLLIAGQFEEGFAEYEWRSRMADFPSPKRNFPSPRWDGSDPAGKTLVIHDEQGVGDAIQFVRYAPLVQALGARVVVECNIQLTRLFDGLRGIEGVVGRGDALPHHDCHVSLLSLPHLLGTTLDTIPASVPYLRAEPELVTAWAGRLASHRALKVGLIWAGNPEFKADRVRSPRLAAFLPLLNVPGVQVFGLQKGPGYDDLAACGALPPSFTDLGPDISNFADTAAIMENLDLVISSCTGPTHLAGALGRPVWTVLPFAPDWRWLGHGETTPWYPTMRLFRQDQRGDWKPVIERVRLALAEAARAHG